METGRTVKKTNDYARKPEEIKLSDWQRILVGEVPGSFYFELLLRVAVVYPILLVSMRLMGKRMGPRVCGVAPRKPHAIGL